MSEFYEEMIGSNVAEISAEKIILPQIKANFVLLQFVLISWCANFR